MVYRTPPMLCASFTPQGEKVQRRLEHIFAKRQKKGGWVIPILALTLLLAGSLVACAPALTASVQLPQKEETVSAEEPEMGYRSPLEKETKVLASYGKRAHPITGVEAIHNGVDLSAEEGDTVLAAAGGKVVSAEYSTVYGNCVVLSHENGQESFYGHLQKFSVEAGQTVNSGEEIGKVGQTGFATAPHLHFEIRENGICLDPTDIVS